MASTRYQSIKHLIYTMLTTLCAMCDVQCDSQTRTNADSVAQIDSGGKSLSFISKALESKAWVRKHEEQQQQAPSSIAWTPNLEVSAVCGLWGRIVNYTNVQPGNDDFLLCWFICLFLIHFLFDFYSTLIIALSDVF